MESVDYYRLHELPETYKKYQKYTDNFEEWFIETAKKRKIEIDKFQVDAKRTREGTKISGKRKKQHRVPIRSFVPITKRIIESGIPLDDKSGLQDLDDIIRGRKEVGAYFQHKAQNDEGHKYIVKQLLAVKKMFDDFFFTSAEEQDLPEEEFLFVFVPPNTEPGKVDGENDQEEILATETPIPALQTKPRKSTKIDKNVLRAGVSPKGPENILLTEEEEKLEQDFQMLCFLYDFRQLRDVVERVWSDYSSKKIGLVSAALVADLAQAIIRRRVGTLLLDLEETTKTKRSLEEVLDNLFTTLSPKSEQDVDSLKSQLCIEAAGCLRKYRQVKDKAVFGEKKNGVVVNFLLFFGQLEEKGLCPPVLDEFTKVMRSTGGSAPWLIFGLQMLLDAQLVLVDTAFHKVYTDVYDGFIRITRSIREHAEYEDETWDTADKPEYMSAGNIKFSNIFLPAAQEMLGWLQSIMEDNKNTPEGTFSAFLFLIMQPIFSGLALYHYQRIYSSFSIAKTNWFLVALSHMYNACRQVGGLSVRWPDLEFVIQSHREDRIFVGERPVDPQFFWSRWRLATQFSARTLAPGYAYLQRNTQWVRATQTVRKNRGLQSFFPLQRLITDYYDPLDSKERWLQFHNLFAHMYQLKEMDAETGVNQDQVAEALKADFEAFVKKLWPKRKTKKTRKKLKVKTPTLGEEPYIYADLLSRTEAELKENELHANFDYLAFFRAAFKLVAQIRNAVLFDSRKNLQHIDGESETISNYYLLDRLLYGLLVEPQNKNFAIFGNEVSKDVVPLNQLRAISRSLKTFIKDAGSSSLRDAKKFMDLSITHPAIRAANPPKNSAGPSYGVYHRLKYNSTVFRRRQNVNLTRFLGLKLKCTKGIKKLVKWSRLIGNKKRLVVFTCFGDCAFGTAAKFLKMYNDYLSPEERSALGMSKRPVRLFKLLREGRNWHIPATADLIEDLALGDNGAPNDASDDDWETAS